MKVQKEIENVTRVPDRYPTEPLTMEDAVIFHKKVIDNYEKMRKDLNKELGIGDIEEEGFTGRTNGKFSTPELKKMKLSESLFKESYTDEPTKDDIISWLFEHDQAWEDACTYFSSDNLEDVNYNDLLDWIFEHDTLSDDMMQHFGEEPFINESLNEELENTDGWPEEIGDELSGAFETLNNLQYEINSCVRGAYTDCNTIEELVEYITDSAEFLIDRAEYLRNEADRLNEDITSKIPKNAKGAWSEKDWIKEFEKAEKENKNVDFSGYSDDEQRYINQRYQDHKKALEDDANYRAQYERKRAKEEEQQRKEEEQKLEQEKKEKIEKAKQAIKSLPNNLKATANKAGINI